MAETIAIDQSTASRTLQRVTKALVARMHEWVQLPTQQQADRQKASTGPTSARVRICQQKECSLDKRPGNV